MLFSYKELKKLANIPQDKKLEDIIHAINSIGFEVEETIPFGDVEGLKFGRVLEVKKNPNADKLNVCKIEFSDKERTIQTNANNVKEGNVVLAFIPGSKLGDIVFAKKEMKGIVSEGMLSSLEELGVNKEFIRDSHGDGIMIYELEDISIDPIEYLGLQDHIIDIDILSNRSDAQSYYVMARELSAYFNTKIEWPSITGETFKSNIKAESGLAKDLIMIESYDCPKVSIKEQIILAKFGIKSINDIVDLTNLTLMMTGQPAHAYDMDIVGNNFKAKKYTGDFEILGNKIISLKDNLVISCDEKPVSIAGVIGGNKTGVNDSTKKFILELGRFPIDEIRKAAKQAKITNFSSSQSSKIISEGTTELGVSFLKSRLENYSNTINSKPSNSLKINYDVEETNKIAGFDITKDPKWKSTIVSLETLGFKFIDGFVEVPSYRHDIKTIQDINEEIFRFFGYDTFKPEAPKIQPTKTTSFKDFKTIITGQGYQEVVTYSLISKEKNIFNPFALKDVVSLQTFASKEREVIRSSQMHSLLEVMEYNAKRKIEDISIFSEGMIGSGEKTLILGSTIKSFEDVKKDTINLIPGCPQFVRTNNPSLHPGVSANIILGDEIIGWIGKPHPALSNINGYFAEIKIKEPKFIKQAKEYSNEPLKSRDITFEIKDGEIIDDYIKNIEVYSMKVIDEFLKDDTNKVTINFKGTEKQIEIIDKKFNE